MTMSLKTGKLSEKVQKIILKNYRNKIEIPSKDGS